MTNIDKIKTEAFKKLRGEQLENINKVAKKMGLKFSSFNDIKKLSSQYKEELRLRLKEHVKDKKQ